MEGRNLIAGLRARAQLRGTVSPSPPFDDRPTGPDDHYIVEREQERREPVGNLLLRVARRALLLFLVVISLAVFCLVALLLGIF